MAVLDTVTCGEPGILVIFREPPAGRSDPAWLREAPG